MLVERHPVDPDVTSYSCFSKEYKSYISDLLKKSKQKYAIILGVQGNFVAAVFRSNEPILIQISEVTPRMLSHRDIRNFLLDDPILDYLEYHRDKLCKQLNISETNNTCKSPQLKRRRTIIKVLAEEFYNKTVNDIILQAPEDFYCAHNNFKRTQELIKEERPIIYKARLINISDNIYSDIDLLVRRDYLSKFMNSAKQVKDRTYVPVFIVFRKIVLKTDKTHACKYPRFILTEGALALASQLLKRKGEVGGYIIGRDKVLARVDVAPSVIEKVKEALTWRIKAIKGTDLVLLPKPNHPCLYPNMKNDDYDRVKTRYAEEIGELTQLSYILPRNREICIRQFGVDSLKDAKFKTLSAKDIGVKGTKAQSSVDLLINVQTMDSPIEFVKTPTLIRNIGAYIDFETFYNFNTELTQPYMLGILYYGNNDWEYKNVVLNGTSEEDNLKFWFEVSKLLAGHKRVMSWGSIERCILTTAGSAKVACLLSLEIVDLCKICINSGLQLPKMKNYKLKEIGRCMREVGLTDLRYGELGSAMDAITSATSHYLTGKNWNLDEIIEYNEIDCKMVKVIHDVVTRYIQK